MKILMVNKFLGQTGGAEAYMLRLGDYFKSLGNKVEYFGMDSEDRCVSNSLDCYTDNIDFRNAGAVKKIQYSIKSVYSAEARRKLSKVLKSFRPDIVHMNNINFQLTPSIIYEIKKFGIPIIQTVHDVQIACPNHRMYIEEKECICTKCSEGSYLNCIREKCVHASLLKSMIAAFESKLYHTRGTYNLVDLYICPSEFIKNTIQHAGIDEKRLIVLHNFSESQAESVKFQKKDYVLYFGRISVEKGIKTLIEVCRELPHIKFVFAGTGPLEGLLNGMENITALGFRSGNELKQLIGEAAFSIIPSEWFENCPMSAIESLSLGTPVIASDLGGTKELVENGKTGIIFKAKNKASLRNAIEKLYNNKQLLSEMQKNAEKTQLETIDSYAQKLLELYQSL